MSPWQAGSWGTMLALAYGAEREGSDAFLEQLEAWLTLKFDRIAG